jgi:hypothetical protein
MGSGEVGRGQGGQMSRQRKTAAVLRLLRGEDLGDSLTGVYDTTATSEQLQSVSSMAR